MGIEITILIFFQTKFISLKYKKKNTIQNNIVLE